MWNVAFKTVAAGDAEAANQKTKKKQIQIRQLL